MRRPSVPTLCIALGFGASALSGCAVPGGSLARPVSPMKEGSGSVGGGVMVPFAVLLGASVEAGSAYHSATARRLAIIPGASFDYAFGDGEYFGIGVAAWTPATLGTGPSGDFLLLFVNPRFEVALDGPDRRLAFTIDTNLAYLSTKVDGESVKSPLLAPTVGIRWYVPTGFGGFIFAQQVGTGIFDVYLPGSLAYDLPIPMGSATLHLFPELHWDPTVFFFGGEGTGIFSFLSGGLSFQVEM